MEFTRPLPVPTPRSRPFWDALKENRIMIQRCRDCDGWVFYPRSNCSHCLGDRLEWKQVTGEGEVYSCTVARTPTAPHFAAERPQLIAVIQLKEGVRLNSVMVNVNAEDLRVGMQVEPVFDTRFAGCTLLHFEPARA